VIRALEITVGTGRPFSYFWGKKSKTRDFETLKIGLRAEREVVYDRINRRVNIMMDLGLLDEVRGLSEFRNLNALQTVGYRELFSHLEGGISLEDAVVEIKKNTRRFAKRQETWYKKDKEINWFDYDTDAYVIINFIESRIKN
jgi:tRNA dimethylallyltransferase